MTLSNKTMFCTHSEPSWQYFPTADKHLSLCIVLKFVRVVVVHDN